ncbi:hypothetical protein PC116_g32139 [Phytophthora cactorum]|nr:hypothetical protein PC120_g28696 [Phytophthora cactorum]KAG4219381.1 hypothetical protein PC116_g32139 [Phytophthora cactorum]
MYHTFVSTPFFIPRGVLIDITMSPVPRAWTTPSSARCTSTGVIFLKFFMYSFEYVMCCVAPESTSHIPLDLETSLLLPTEKRKSPESSSLCATFARCGLCRSAFSRIRTGHLAIQCPCSPQ